MNKKEMKITLHKTELTEETVSVEYPIYIKYEYANEHDYVNFTIVKVKKDDTYTELSKESSGGFVSYSVDTGIYSYSGNDINRILGRTEYSSTEEEYEVLTKEISEFLNKEEE